MPSPRLLSLMAISLLEAPSHAYENTVLEKLSFVVLSPEARLRYLELVEKEALRLSAKRSLAGRNADAQRAREFAERLLVRAAA